MSRAMNKHKINGFSLIELVIVIVIIAIIGAIAIPRMSRGAAGAADSALTGDLAVLRNAIDLYAAEHTGTFPKAATFEAQMTQFTDDNGGTSATKTGNFVFGPYLRKLPPLPVGTKKGQTAVADEVGGAVIGAGNFGWFYNENTGVILANLPAGEKDAKGKDYNTY